MDRAFKITTIIAVLIIAFSIFYYLVIFLPQKEQTKLELEERLRAEVQKAEEARRQEEEEEKKLNKILLEACIESAYDTYIEDWNKNCRTSGINKRTDDCTLPLNLANSLNDIHKEMKDECFKKYPQK